MFLKSQDNILVGFSWCAINTLINYATKYEIDQLEYIKFIKIILSY